MKTGKATEEEINEIAKLLLTRKYGSRQIGAALGRTKGSIIGIIWRTPRLKAIGLPNPPPTNIKKTQVAATVEPVNPKPPVIVGPRTLINLGPFHCKFPLWSHQSRPSMDSLFCAQARLSDSPYCEKHHKVCCNPVPGRQPRLKQVA